MPTEALIEITKWLMLTLGAGIGALGMWVWIVWSQISKDVQE